MRWYILKTLIHKEALRHLANRGGIVLALLLIVMAMLLSFFGNKGAQNPALGPGAQQCYIDYWDESPWIQHLKSSVPADLAEQLRFRFVPGLGLRPGDVLYYPMNAGAIQIRPLAAERNVPQFLVWLWHPGKDQTVLSPYEAWFWKESNSYWWGQTLDAAQKLGAQAPALVLPPKLVVQNSSLSEGFDPRIALATALVLFANFFVCVYLLPSLTCEERERGILLAQALSPATPFEILAAKFIFYPIVACLLAGILGGIYRPRVLIQPIFWGVLVVAAFGSLGIGLTISSFAKTQRTASMTALCYMLVVAFGLFVCQQNSIPFLPWLAIEYHAPRMLNSVLSGAIGWYLPWQLLAMTILAYIWSAIAIELFRRRGWQ